jgi:hypothetical protein
MCYNSANDDLLTLLVSREIKGSFIGMRQFERFSYREPMSYRVPLERSWNNELSAVSGGILGYDISEGGVRFRTDMFVPAGVILQLTFTVPPGKAVTLAGQVVWVQKLPHSENYQVGFAFDRSSDNMAERETIKAAFALEM